MTKAEKAQEKKIMKKKKFAMRNILSYWTRVSNIPFEGDPNNEEDVETYAGMCRDIAIERSKKRKEYWKKKNEEANNNSKGNEYQKTKEEIKEFVDKLPEVSEESVQKELEEENATDKQ